MKAVTPGNTKSTPAEKTNVLAVASSQLRKGPHIPQDIKITPAVAVPMEKRIPSQDPMRSMELSRAKEKARRWQDTPKSMEYRHVFQKSDRATREAAMHALAIGGLSSLQMAA
jgi:hypothetical protein